MTDLTTKWITPHADLGADDYHQVYFEGSPIKADKLGRPNPRMIAADWRKVRCNNTDCPGWGIVRVAAILAMFDAPSLRQRVEAILESDEHVVDFEPTKFGVQHPIRCRPNLIGCAVDRALTLLSASPVTKSGRYLVSVTAAGKVAVGARVADDYDPLDFAGLLT